MTKKRITWILIILFAAILYLFANGTGTLALLISCIAAPLISLLIIFASGRHMTITLDKVDPDSEEQSIKLFLKNHDIMPVSNVVVTVRCRNLRTGETEQIDVTKSLRPKGKAEEIIKVIPSHAGKYEISIESAGVSDPLQLWQRKIAAEDRLYITVMPTLFDMDLLVTSSSSAMPESYSYIDGRNGNDPGEVRGIREYVPGDSIKNIHWKLSSKVDKLLVKEMGLPITDQFLVILDNAADVGLNPDALDAIASVFRSVLNTLMSEGVDFTAGWTSPDTGEPVFRRIRDELSYLDASEEYLAVPAITQSAFERIERGIIDSRFAHLIMVGSQIPYGIDSITNGCQVTLLMYGVEGYSKTDAGTAIIGFDESTYMNELAQLEV
ncbi:MAG: DUF58 domain-containing protein [Mogibacterium sp.]|nr:DUF58 domain-containing protein [Mogibacterium sp.]